MSCQKVENKKHSIWNVPMLTLEPWEDLVSLKGHEVHNLEVGDPELGQDVDIDRGHGELVPHRLVWSGGVIVKQRGHQSLVLPLDVEISIQCYREILIRHLKKAQQFFWFIIEVNKNLKWMKYLLHYQWKTNLWNVLDMNLYEDPDRLVVEWEVVLLVTARQTDHVLPALEAVLGPRASG